MSQPSQGQDMIEVWYFDALLVPKPAKHNGSDREEYDNQFPTLEACQEACAKEMEHRAEECFTQATYWRIMAGDVRRGLEEKVKAKEEITQEVLL